MKILKELFEKINKEAFQLISTKEIYTRTLTEEECDDNTKDYISGFQIIDTNIRITIIEGVTEKGIKLVKERLPKLNINSSNKKVFANSQILFDTRIYSKFNLCLKFIKLRNILNDIITTADIYLKSNKYREIFVAFMNLGSILQSSSLQAIADAKLFPNADSLLLLERKYADILIDEDMTGIHTETKKKKKIKIEDNNTNNTSK
jgi:hypothetical protein